MIHKNLKNGTESYIERTTFSNLVTLEFIIKTGSFHEKTHETGIAHLLEHMLFKGSKRFPKLGQVAKEIEKHGGDINAYTSYDHTCYYITVPSKYVTNAIDILVDILFESILDDNELSKELEVIKEEILRSEDNPNSYLSRKMFSNIFSKTPLERPILGFKTSIKNFKRSSVFKFYKKWYVPNNLICIIIGNINEEKTFSYLEESLKPYKESKIQKLKAHKLPLYNNIRKKSDIEFGNWQESRIQLAIQIPNLESQFTAIWDVFSCLLTDGDSSIFSREIQNKKCLVTAIDSLSYTPSEHFGFFNIGFLSKGDKVYDALEMILKLIQDLAKEPPSQKQLKKILYSLKAQKIYAKESLKGLSQEISLCLQTTEKLSFSENYLKKVSQVTPHDISKIAHVFLENIHSKKFVLTGIVNKRYKPILSDAKLKKHILRHSFLRKIGRLEEKVLCSKLDKNIKQIKLNVHGITISVNYRHSKRLPITSFKLITKGGQCYEKTSEEGLSALTSSMLTRGNQFVSFEKFCENLEDISSSITSFSSKEFFGLRGDALKEHSLETISMLLEAFLYPKFEASQLKILCHETIEHIKSQKDNSYVTLSQNTFKSLFEKHPYGHWALGKMNSVKSISIKKIRDYYSRILSNRHFIFSIVGDFEIHDILKLVKEKFHGISDLYLKPKPFTAPVLKLNRSQTSLEFNHSNNKEQSHIFWGFLGPSIFDKERTSLEVLSQILSNQSGRLFLDLRDNLSLAYSVSAHQVIFSQSGVFLIYIATHNDKVFDTLKALKRLLASIVKTPPSKQDIEKAVKILINNRNVEEQNYSYQASQLALSEGYGLKFDNFLAFEKRLKSVNQNSIKRALRIFFIPKNMFINIVGHKKRQTLNDIKKIINA